MLIGSDTYLEYLSLISDALDSIQRENSNPRPFGYEAEALPNWLSERATQLRNERNV